MSTTEIFNAIVVSDDVLTAGQPSEDQLRAIAEEGYQCVINLAPIDPRYSLADELGLVGSLGMAYHHIPVDWEAPELDAYQAFKSLMETVADQRCLVHCAANYRVTAFYSLYAMDKEGWTEQQAETFMAPIWESNPEWQMSASWRALIETVRGMQK